MGLFRLVLRNLIYSFRSHLATAGAVMISTAVICGSLIIGDSANRSLLDNSMRRLGQVELAAKSAVFFRSDLAKRIGLQENGNDKILSCLLLEGTVRPQNDVFVSRGVSVCGVDDSFFTEVYPNAEGGTIAERQAIIGGKLAGKLGLKPGDNLLLNLRAKDVAPAASIFGKRKASDQFLKLRVRVGIIQQNSDAEFFNPFSSERRECVFLNRAWLARNLGIDGKANALLITKENVGSIDESETASSLVSLNNAVRRAASLEDMGFEIKPVPAIGKFIISSQKFVFNKAQVAAILEAAKSLNMVASRLSVYLASRIFVNGSKRSASYCTVAGLDANLWSGLVISGSAGGVVLNQWLADRLNGRAGAEVTVEYLQALPSGDLGEKSCVFKVSGTMPMQGWGAEPLLVPPYPGLTDSENVSDWDPPFPIDLDRVTDDDEAYWDKYKASPKMFLPLSEVEKMWGEGQAGGISSILVSMKDRDGKHLQLDELSTLLARSISEPLPVLTFIPVRQQALVRARQSTDLGTLFLSLGFFLMASSIVLTGLSFILVVEKRRRQIALLSSLGIPSIFAFRMFLLEGAVVATVGSLAGGAGGIIYSQALIEMLSGSWSGAVGGADLSLYVSPLPVMIGIISGIGVSCGAIYFALRRKLGRASVDIGLAGVGAYGKISGKGSLNVFTALLAAAISFSIIGSSGVGGGAILWFMLAGVSGLAGMIFLSSHLLGSTPLARKTEKLGIASLILRSASRARGRSLTVIIMTSCAAFMVTAITANRKSAPDDLRRPDSGNGGYSLAIKIDLPVRSDISQAGGRKQFGISENDNRLLGRSSIVPILVNSGDDASCRNIGSPLSPTVLGVPGNFALERRFRFAGTARELPEGLSPWTMLDYEDADGALPAIADAASAQWIIKKRLGDIIAVSGFDGKPVKLRLVALLSESIFQGELIVSQENFRKAFGSDPGYKRFLVSVPPTDMRSAQAIFTENLSSFGADIRTTSEIIESYSSVQNTYIAAFSTLGGLGVLLGTFGTVFILIRNIIERRRELATMYAVGFPRARIMNLVVFENAALGIWGILSGVACGGLAVSPQLSATDTGLNWFPLAALLFASMVSTIFGCRLAAGIVLSGNLLEGLRSE